MHERTRRPGHRPFCCLVLGAASCSGGDPALCPEVPAAGGTMLTLADFETGADPTTFGGHLGSWDNNGEPVVRVRYEASSAPTGGDWAVAVEITGNDGDGEGGWTGGGLVLTLNDGVCIPDLDLSSYSTLRFEVRVASGSQLEETRVKLEDAAGTERPERALSEYGVEVSTEWQTVAIPLETFTSLRDDDPDWWMPLDPEQVTAFVTVSVHDGQTTNGDGTLYIDNLSVEQ